MFAKKPLQFFPVIYIIITAFQAHACNVPIFRYALERWQPDPYRIVVIADSLEKSNTIKYINETAVSNFANITLFEPEIAPLSQSARDFEKTGVYLLLPQQTGMNRPVYHTSLDPQHIDSLLFSPVRKELADRLLSGHTAVFLFLPGPDEDVNKTKFDLLQNELDSLSQVLEIPKTGYDSTGQEISTRGDDLEVKFSVLALSKQEKVLAEILINSESDLVYYPEPMVFPVFGQGRSLYALVGNGIHSKNIHRACQSLVTWCSCEVKELHQGMDLLISADWSRIQDQRSVTQESLPELTTPSAVVETFMDSLAKPAPAKPVEQIPETQKIVQTDHDSVQTPPKTETQDIPQQPTSFKSDLLKNMVLVFIFAFVLLIIISIIKKRK